MEKKRIIKTADLFPKEKKGGKPFKGQIITTRDLPDPPAVPDEKLETVTTNEKNKEAKDEKD